MISFRRSRIGTLRAKLRTLDNLLTSLGGAARYGDSFEGNVEHLLGRPLEVEVRDSLEKAMKILKQKMSKEGILQELKRRRFYEKPSVKKKRKTREARKRRRREQKRRV